MAIFSFNSGVIRRSQEHSAVHTAAYYRGTKMCEERTGTITSCISKEEVAYSKIVACENAPEWVQKLLKSQHFGNNAASELLWNKVVNREKRRDSQEAYKHFCALPNEMTLEQAIALADEIAKMIASYGTIVDHSIHWKKGNCYMYMLETMRHLTENGFGLKNTALSQGVIFITGKANPNSRIWKIREQAAAITNKHFIVCGIKAHIDHRTLEVQGSPLKATSRLGSTSSRAAEKGVLTARFLKNEQIKKDNFNYLAKDATPILKQLAQETNDFTCEDVAEKIIKYIPVEEILRENEPIFKGFADKDIDKILDTVVNEENQAVFSERELAKILNISNIAVDQFTQILHSIILSKKLIYLGIGNDGRDRYTTKSCFAQETKMIDEVETLATKMNHFVKEKRVNKAIANFEKLKSKEHKKGYKLSDEKICVIKHLVSGADINCLVDQVGSDKAIVLASCINVWKSEGFKIIGAALTNIAVNNFSKCGFDETVSTATLLKNIKKSKNTLLDSQTILVIDESSMICSDDIAEFVGACCMFGAKLILVGSQEQLHSVNSSAAFKIIEELASTALLDDVIQHKEKWQRKASVAFAAGDIRRGLEIYLSKGNINFITNDHKTKGKLINDWANDTSILREKIIVGHENNDINELNFRARQVLLDSNYLKGSNKLTMHLKKGEKTIIANIDIAINERITFKKGGYVSGTRITNNQMANIKDIQVDEKNKIKYIVVNLDGFRKDLTLDARDIREHTIELTHGYAASASKINVVSLGRVYYYASAVWNRAWLNIAIARHRSGMQIYVSNERFKNFNALVHQYSKKSIKDSVLKFPMNFSLNRGLELKNLVGLKFTFVDRIIKSSEDIRDFIEQKIKPSKYLVGKEHEAISQHEIEPQEYQQHNTIQWRTNAAAVNQYLDANKIYDRAWAALKEYAKENGYWDEIDDKIKSVEIQHLPESINIRKITDIINELIDLLFYKFDECQQTLKYFGVDKEILERKQRDSKFFNAVCKYKQGRDKLVNAKIISDILESDSRYYLKFADADINQKILKSYVKEYQRQLYLKELKGEHLVHFKLIERYDIQCLNARESKEIYENMVEQIKISKSVDDLDIAPEDGDSSGIGFKEDHHINDNYELDDASKDEKNNLNLAKQNWLEQQAICEASAYEIQKTAQNSIGLKFYEFDNHIKIQKLKAKYKIEENRVNICNRHTLLSLEKQLKNLRDRQEQILRDANYHRCLVNIIEYQRTEDSGVASRIRATLKDRFSRNYRLAQEYGISWSKLLAKGEDFDKSKIYQSLDHKQKIYFNRLEEYLELDRIEYDEDIPFIERAKTVYKKSVIAYKIVSEIEAHKDALEF